jgi:hypothetical protein
MLKKVSCIAIIVLPLFAQYSYDFTCTTDTIQIANPLDAIYFWFRLENTGSQEDIYEFDCTVIHPVPDWDVTYCITGF